MYENFYHLKARPFDHTPDPAFLYLSKGHREVLASLVYGINYAKGFILVGGDVGTGKTTLIQALLTELGPKFVVTHISNPRRGFGEIFYRLSKSLGLHFSEKTQTPESYYALKLALEKIDKAGKRTVLIIDEAHLLSEECLEHIRLLSNYETESRKLIQIVLVGQNEIYQTLRKDGLKSLQQRIVINRVLQNLERKEIEKYIRHRLRVAGRETALFDRKAIALIWEQSRGAPRVINNICDNALMTGYALESHKIGSRIIQEVIDDMAAGFTARKLPAKSRTPIRKLVLPAAAAVLLTIVFLIGYALKNEPLLPGGTGDILEAASPVKPAAIAGKTAPETQTPPPGTEATQTAAADKAAPATEKTETETASPPPGTEAMQTAAADKAAPVTEKTETEEPDIAPIIAGIHQQKDNGAKRRSAGGASETTSKPASDGASPPAADAAEAPGDDDAPRWGPDLLNACLAKRAEARYGVGNDTVVDLLRQANPTLKRTAGDCTAMQIVFPVFEKSDLILEQSDGTFRIHYASFYSADAASALTRKLTLAGRKAAVAPVKQGDYQVFRVLAGRYSNHSAAESALAGLTLDHLPFLRPQQTARKKMLLEVLKEIQ
jgi:general secretion pathway protein A